MNIIYIGQYSEGTTSKMRCDILIDTLKPEFNSIIDIHIPFFKTNWFWRSVGFRYKLGPLIKSINNFVLKSIKEAEIKCFNQSQNKKFDLIWVDKSVFIKPRIILYLKQRAKKLVHFTPDPAFTFHRSKYFRKSLSLFDYAVTTKKYEIEYYKKYLNENQIIYTTQGYDKDKHQPTTSFDKKRKEVLFIGHYEVERGKVISELINNDIKVAIAGLYWTKFYKRNKYNTNLNYLGEGIYGDQYTKTISSYLFSWGAVSKWIPELHTTRTFEIPACGTALITERNLETESFFCEDEVLLYNSNIEMIDKIKYYMNNLEELRILTEKGKCRISKDGRDYNSIIKTILKRLLIN